MATHQSDFERERQRILAEIEARARKGSGELTLQDWLKAAEEVMPDDAQPGRFNKQRPSQTSQRNSSLLSDTDEDVVVKLSSSPPLRSAKDTSKKPQQPQRKQTMKQDVPQPQKKNAIFTSIIFGTLFLLMLASGGFAYLHVQKEVSALSASLEKVQNQLSELNVKLETLDKRQVTGGNSAAFDALQNKVAKLEQKVDQAPAGSKQVSDQIKSELNASNVITEAELDAKLEQFSKRIEQAIDKRFTTILAQLKHLNASNAALMADETETAAQTTPTEDATSEEAEIAPEMAPSPPAEPIAPKVTPPAQPTASHTAKAEGNLTADEQWLASLPDNHYVMQLASVLDRNRLENLKQKRGLESAHIVRQYRAGQVFYVLVMGDYPGRGEAMRAAKMFKNTTGINPWVRQAKDLKRNLRNK